MSLSSPIPPLQQLTSLGAYVTVLDEVDSTNRWLLEQGQHGAVCIADQQTSGRGRRGREWQSPAGLNLYLSLRWHFQTPPSCYSWLSLMIGTVIAEVLQQQGIRGHQLKWPNDLYYRGKKFGGILLQTAERLEQVVIGIGLNINMDHLEHEQIDQPWCSLKQITGVAVDRTALAAKLIPALLMYLERFPQMDVDAHHYAWQRWDMLSQHSVKVQALDHTLDGIACGLDGQGRLLVLDSTGNLHTFSSADVSVRL